jgi:hypothetical protein
LAPGDFRDRSFTETTTDDAVVIEDDDSVGGDPGVGFESGGAQASSEEKGLEGVLGRMGAGPSVGETDGRIES